MTIISGGLIAAALSYLNIELNKESLRKKSQEERCNKLEDKVFECISFYEKLKPSVSQLSSEYKDSEERLEKYIQDGEELSVIFEDLRDNKDDIQRKYEQGELEEIFAKHAEFKHTDAGSYRREKFRKGLEIVDSFGEVYQKIKELEMFSTTTGKIYEEMEDFCVKIGCLCDALKADLEVRMDRAFEEKKAESDKLIERRREDIYKLVTDASESFHLFHSRIDEDGKEFYKIKVSVLKGIVFLLFFLGGYNLSEGRFNEESVIIEVIGTPSASA